MAAFSTSAIRATDISGTACGAIFQTPDFAYLGLPVAIPAMEYERGAVAEIKITASGAFTLKIAFSKRVYRTTGTFVEQEGSTPEFPYHVAVIGETTEGFIMQIDRGPDGVVAFFWDDAEGNGAGGGMALSPVVQRDGLPIGEIAAYNTVFIRPYPLLQGNDSSPEDLKVGTGYGSLKIRASGRSTFVGVLPDGKTVTANGPLTFGADLGVPVLLRASAKDSLVCSLPVMDQLEAQGIWYKKASNGNNTIHPAGGPLGVTITSAPYTPPTSGELAILGTPDQPLNAVLELLAADRPGAGSPSDPVAFLTQPFKLKANHQAVFPAPNTDKLKVDFHPQTGFFTGSVKLPVTPPLQPKKVEFRGVVKQHRNDGYGEAEGFYVADPLPGTVDAPKVSGLVRIAPSVVSAE
ncbi:MAG: hypothetical protein V4662_23760 [Verrucomicrobiota bacterium]